MTGNIFGKRFRVMTWGESHGPAVGAVIDGCPSRLQLAVEDIEKELSRRRPGHSALSSPRKESDRVELLSGVFEGVTIGTPISMLIFNEDVRSKDYSELRDKVRPGHADYTYHAKYGRRDHRGGGRSSGRETVGRVAAGAVAKKLLRSHAISITGHVTRIGDVSTVGGHDLALAEKSPVRCADPEASLLMERLIKDIQREGESVGGVVEVVAKGVPPGVGEPVFDKLDAEISKAIMGIGAVKGVELGAGFKAAAMYGSESNDPFIIKNGIIETSTNNAGGVLGGISTGMDIVVRLAVKPTPSISKPQKTVDITRGEETVIEIDGRHDPAIPPRLVPIAEAMMALVLVDAMMVGGFIPPVCES